MKVLSLKLREENEALYRQLFDASGSGTADMFFSDLLEAYVNPRKVEVSKPEDLARISQLEAENEAIRNAQGQSLPADQERISELEHKIFLTESENAILKEKDSNSDIVKIHLNPAMAELVDRCVNRAAAKTGKQFTRVDIFQNLFWEALKAGRASLPIIFSSSEIAQTLNKHKTQVAE